MRDSEKESPEVQRGLRNLREAHFRALRVLQGEGTGQSTRAETRKPSYRVSVEESEAFVNRFRELRGLIEKVEKECRIEGPAIRKSF